MGDGRRRRYVRTEWAFVATSNMGKTRDLVDLVSMTVRLGVTGLAVNMRRVARLDNRFVFRFARKRRRLADS